MTKLKSSVGWAERSESHRARRWDSGYPLGGSAHPTATLPQPRQKCQSRHPRRAGYALVELLVVISVNAVLMAVAVGLIGTLLRTEHQGQHHWERTSTLVRLADQFRDDVAAARDARLLTSDVKNAAQVGLWPDRLRLQTSADRAIEYRRDGDRLRRIEYQGESIARREAYRLIYLSDVEFIVPATPIVTLRLTFGDGAREVSLIEARLAKDWRFAAASESPDSENTP